MPVDGEHIGFVTAHWPPDDPTAGVLLLPWERCKPADKDPSRVYPQNTRSVFVLWLPAANFDPVPLSRFGTLLTSLVPQNLRGSIDIKLIGPLNSAGLENMEQEVLDWRRKDEDATLNGPAALQKQMQDDALRNNALRGVCIISPRATMSDEALLYHPQAPPSLVQPALGHDQSVPLKESVEREIENGVPAGLHFLRTITSDDIVLDQLIDELKLRGIDVRQDLNPFDKIVILTEWDSPYGRSLAMTFGALVTHQTYASVIQDPINNWPKLILHYRYLRGIDGRLPGQLAKSTEPETNQKKQITTAQPKPEEATGGVDQSDYLRRLARELKKKDVALQRRGGGVRAIGLLGSDTYDKLMILRALRPEFPDAVFFTNNLDAHLERRADWPYTHNLVIVSPFGTKLPAKSKLQSNIPPFRDNIQTSMYAGTLVATGKIKNAEDLATPNVFEISRNGAYDFGAPAEETRWFLDWLHTGGRKLALAFAAIWILMIALWLKLAVVNRKPAEWGILAKLICDTPLWLGFWVPVVIFGVSFFAQISGHQEPLAFFSGISIWPSEMLRLIAGLLAIHFIIKASAGLKSNELEIAEHFCLSPLKKVGSRWDDFLEGLKPWQIAHAAWLVPEAQFTAEEAWHAYLRR